LKKTSEKVRTTLVAKILDQRKSELDDLSIKYKQSAITDMQQLIEPNKAVLIFAPGRSTTLTAAKIHQMLSAIEHKILNLQQFMRYKTEVMLAWQSSFDVLVLESQSSTKNFQDAVDEISIMLDDCGVKKFIFISGRECNTQQLSALRGTFGTKLAEEYDDWKLADIITESTKFLLEKHVTFQGTETQIKHLVKGSDVRMLNTLDCDSISLLLANEKPPIGTPTESTLQYYIYRTLERVTNFQIGNQTEIETPVKLKKERLDELQGTSSYREDKCDVSDNGQELSQFALIIRNEKGRRKVCSGINTLESLCTGDQRFLMRQNTDDYLKVQNSFHMKPTKLWRPSTLLDGEDRMILVTDDPGMGKSTLLTHLANQTRANHHDMWIVRVNINNYTRILHGIKANGFEEKDAIKLLTEAAQIRETEGAQLERQLFNYMYNSTGNMAVMVDGVEEVSPHYSEEVLQILRMLSKTKIRKIWVTSRNTSAKAVQLPWSHVCFTCCVFNIRFLSEYLGRNFVPADLITKTVSVLL
jgi:predicted ATPase